MANSKIQQFQQLVYDYFNLHRRDLPWRKTHDPYAILISEIMLQQTQVSRVLPKYSQWLTVLPTLESLAQASFSEVLSLWSGLGYNRRAKYVHQLAQTVMETFHGQLPTDQKLLLTLPGMGPYTSAAVCVFAFNQPIPLIETNVRTVFIHHFFSRQSEVSDTQLYPLVELYLDTAHPRKWFNALMDYGSHLKSTLGNANQKSTHYRKPDKFEGSLRQTRGHILKLLLEFPRIKLNNDWTAAAMSLEKDGLIKITPDGDICLKQS